MKKQAWMDQLRRVAAMIAAAGVLVAANPTAASEAHAGEAIARLRAFSKDLSSLKADFVQMAYDADGYAEESKGTMSMQRPDLLRWDYLTPYEQQIIADGQKVWTYDIDLEQVTVREQGEALQRSALSALTDSARLHLYFEVVDEGRRDGLLWVLLTPKDNDEFEQVRLGFQGDLMTRMLIADQLGQSTAIHFTQIERNAELEEGLFSFTPPANVDVLGDFALTDSGDDL